MSYADLLSAPTSGGLPLSQPLASHPGPGQLQSYQSAAAAMPPHMQHMQIGQPQNVLASNQQQQQQQMVQMQQQQLQPHQFQSHGKGGGVQAGTQMHMMSGVATTVPPQTHPMSQVQQQQQPAPHQQQQQQQPGMRMNMPSQMGTMQRPAAPTGMVAAHMQQPMNPPPYGRGGAQGAYGMSGAAAPSSTYGGAPTGQPIMIGQTMQQNTQPQPVMQQGVQNLRCKF
ncbi:unnamed protein product [Gongylonema pulchrum]|uniref:Mastermind-like protein 3 n=1 Tax=Gongylonema pulchrum TaxID=637853 RepID=A0A183EM51_9BILA|nr:unnamed protein product [Gongylonema pulchrum]